MATYRLLPREGTCTFQRIMSGRKWVGRVVQHADGDWLGIIDKESVRRPTAMLAFDDIVATHLGYESGAQLRAQNARVRQVKRIYDKATDAVYSEVLHGNFKPLDVVVKGRPVGLEMALRGAIRDLKRK